MPDFAALRIHEQHHAVTAGIERLTLAALTPGEVVIRVARSSVNYKDALAATGAGRILRRYPLNGGIDLAGVVTESGAARYRAGDTVLVTGCGLSETRDGGYAGYVRVPADAVIAMPPGLDMDSSMIIGTAGFAAALAIMRLQHNGLRPEQGPVLVTGASGGVGALAINMLSGLGFSVTAMSGKPECEQWLRSLGATDIVPRSVPGRSDVPLASMRWAGAIDNVGGDTLSAVLAALKITGSVASVGMAQGAALHTTVMPFILRGVNLLGVNSSSSLRPLRELVWARLASDLKPRALAAIHTRTVALGELMSVFPEYLHGKVHGRTLVRVS